MSCLPIAWAIAIVVDESHEPIDDSDDWGTGEIVAGIRAYQWGWEYSFPKNLGFGYHIPPTYVPVTGNSLKYSAYNSPNAASDKIWKSMRSSNLTGWTSAAAHTILYPTDNLKVLNFIDFNSIGASTIKASYAFRTIQFSTKLNQHELFNTVSDLSLRHTKINNLYLNDLILQDTSTYRINRQSNYTSLKSVLNNTSTCLDNKSVCEVLSYNFGVNSKSEEVTKSSTLTSNLIDYNPKLTVLIGIFTSIQETLSVIGGILHREPAEAAYGSAFSEAPLKPFKQTLFTSIPDRNSAWLYGPNDNLFLIQRLLFFWGIELSDTSYYAGLREERHLDWPIEAPLKPFKQTLFTSIPDRNSAWLYGPNDNLFLIQRLLFFWGIELSDTSYYAGLREERHLDWLDKNVKKAAALQVSKEKLDQRILNLKRDLASHASKEGRWKEGAALSVEKEELRQRALTLKRDVALHTTKARRWGRDQYVWKEVAIPPVGKGKAAALLEEKQKAAALLDKRIPVKRGWRAAALLEEKQKAAALLEEKQKAAALLEEKEKAAALLDKKEKATAVLDKKIKKVEQELYLLRKAAAVLEEEEEKAAALRLKKWLRKIERAQCVKKVAASPVEKEKASASPVKKGKAAASPVEESLTGRERRKLLKKLKKLEREQCFKRVLVLRGDEGTYTVSFWDDDCSDR
jgi:hypothetical protein